MTRRRVVADVMLGSEAVKVGVLVFDKDGDRQYSMFRYSPGWLENKDSFAVSPSMPLLDVPFYSSGGDARLSLPDAIADASPDSWGRSLINAALGRRADEIDFLLMADDRTRQGALRFRDENGNFLSNTSPGTPRLVNLPDLRRLAQAWETNSLRGKDVIAELQGYVGSLGGARPKANLVDGGILSLVKFTSELDRAPVEQAEVATLQLAARAGIQAARARVGLENTSKPVAIIERFDRRGQVRIPYLSARSFMGREAPDPVYYTDIADMMVAHCENPRQQLQELYRRILFNILVSNNDDHLQNHGFLYAGNNRWHLSPAFDINPQPQRRQHLKTGISELSGNEASIEAAVEASPFFDVEQDTAIGMLKQMLDVIEQDWRGLFNDAGMSEDQLLHYEGAFNHKETLTGKKITGLQMSADARPDGRADQAQEEPQAGLDAKEQPVSPVSP